MTEEEVQEAYEKGTWLVIEGIYDYDEPILVKIRFPCEDDFWGIIGTDDVGVVHASDFIRAATPQDFLLLGGEN